MLENIKLNSSFAVLVGAYGPARHFVEYFGECGIDVLHVEDTTKDLRGFGFGNADKYAELLEYSGDFNALCEHINKYANSTGKELKCIITGMEPGVLLADKLSSHFGVISNGNRMSNARRDKLLMRDAVKNAGLNCPMYWEVNSFTELQAKFEKHSNWPLVLKPTLSAGTNGVTINNSFDELVKSFDTYFGETNNLGIKNDKLLVEQYLSGQEYSVNSVSVNGKCFITSIWKAVKTTKKGCGTIYDYNELVVPTLEPKLYNEISSYISKVLDSLEIKYGPAHTEVIFTSDGPVVVDCGARISGSCEPRAMNASLGTDQMKQTVAAYLNGDLFCESQSQPYVIHKNCVQSYFRVERKSRVNLDIGNELRKIESFTSCIFKKSVGDTLESTIDLATSPGFVNLVNDSTEKLYEERKVASEIFNTCIEEID